MPAAPKPTEGPSNLPNKTPKANAAVLLVEDDDGVRRFLFWALYLEGFKVLTARELSDAQRLSRDIPGRIEVLIIGSLPPGASRVGLQEQIEAERSEVRTIFLDDVQSPEQEATRTDSDPRRESAHNRSVDAGQLIQKIKALVGPSTS